MSRLVALAVLGLRAVLHYLVRPFRRMRVGEQNFVRQFLADDLLPTHGPSRDLFVMAARCTGCGLCDSLCALEGRLPAGGPGPSYIARAMTRSTPDLAVAQGDLAVFRECGDCRRCERWCPYDVPLQALLDDARATLERLERRKSKAAGGPST